MEILSNDDSSPKAEVYQKEVGATTKANDIFIGGLRFFLMMTAL